MLQQFDERNKEIKVHVNGELLHRNNAKISVFDSVVQGGDAVWEGIRVYEQGIFLLDKHIDRLIDSAHALMFKNVPSREKIIKAITETLVANKMFDQTHIRLTLTRGEKITSGMDPRLNQQGCGLIVLAEWKPPVYDQSGIKIITSTIRRNAPSFLDSKMHHNNLLNNIQAKIQSNVAGVDAALMLDDRGFVSELNGTNIFMAKNGKILTPHANACLPGITRRLALDICAELSLSCKEVDLSLTEFYTADLVFCTGSMGELTPIVEIDGRTIKDDRSLLDKLNIAFHDKKKEFCKPIQS